MRQFFAGLITAPFLFRNIKKTAEFVIIRSRQKLPTTRYKIGPTFRLNIKAVFLVIFTP